MFVSFMSHAELLLLECFIEGSIAGGLKDTKNCLGKVIGDVVMIRSGSTLESAIGRSDEANSRIDVFTRKISELEAREPKLETFKG